jgi:hypothetical protein
MAKPTDNSEVFLDQLIASIQTHLPTIKGMYLTTSLYPPLLTPGPGAVPFIGYTIPPASRGTGGGSIDNLQSTPEEQALEQKRIEEAITLTPEEELIAEDATEKGYGINESTSAGLSRQSPSSPAERNNSESNGSESNSSEDSNAANATNSEKILPTFLGVYQRYGYYASSCNRGKTCRNGKRQRDHRKTFRVTHARLLR